MAPVLAGAGCMVHCARQKTGARAGFTGVLRHPGIDESGITWGGSSAGRASRSQCEGREFDPPPLHHYSKNQQFSIVFFRPFPQCWRGFGPCCDGRRRPGQPRGGRFFVLSSHPFSSFCGGGLRTCSGDVGCLRFRCSGTAPLRRGQFSLAMSRRSSSAIGRSSSRQFTKPAAAESPAPAKMAALSSRISFRKSLMNSSMSRLAISGRPFARNRPPR